MSEWLACQRVCEFCNTVDHLVCWLVIVYIACIFMLSQPCGHMVKAYYFEQVLQNASLLDPQCGRNFWSVYRISNNPAS